MESGTGVHATWRFLEYLVVLLNGQQDVVMISNSVEMKHKSLKEPFPLTNFLNL